MSRYYPGFLAALFIVLLRLAIGWHFLYEGSEKVRATVEGKTPFSAEMYVRNATGPFAPFFRNMVPDVDGLGLLDEQKLAESWSRNVEAMIDHFQFDEKQKTQAQEILDENLQWSRYWFQDPENVEKLKKYEHDLAHVVATERNPRAIEYEKERAWELRRALDGDRRALVAPLVARAKAMLDSVVKIASADQIESSGSPAARWTSLDVANYLTMFGLIAIGLCLMAGFLTPFAAVAAAVFLAMIYLSMPPWPGLPENPRAEGHYWIVSKNLVELLACLVIATTPSGHWAGLDALVFGARRRRKLAARAAGQREAQAIHDDPNRPRHPVPMP